MEKSLLDLINIPCRYETISNCYAPVGCELIGNSYQRRGHVIIPGQRFVFDQTLAGFGVSILGSQLGLRGYSERVNLSLPVFNAMYLIHAVHLGLPMPDFTLLNRIGDRINYSNWEERDCFTILNCSWYSLIGNDNRYFLHTATPAVNISALSVQVRKVDCENMLRKLSNCGLGNYIFQICACFFSSYFALESQGVIHQFPWSFSAPTRCVCEFNQVIHTTGFYFQNRPNDVYKTQMDIPQLTDLAAFLSVVYQLFMSIGYTFAPNCPINIPPDNTLYKCRAMQVLEQIKDERGAVLQFGVDRPYVFFHEVLDHSVSLLVGSCNIGGLLRWPGNQDFFMIPFDYTLGSASSQRIRDWFPRHTYPIKTVWLGFDSYEGGQCNFHISDLGSFYYYRDCIDLNTGRSLIYLITNNNQKRVERLDCVPMTHDLDAGCKLIEDIRIRNFATYYQMLTHPLEWDGITALEVATQLDGKSDSYVLEWIRQVGLKIRGTPAEAYASGSNFTVTDQLKLRQKVLDHLHPVTVGEVSIKEDNYRVFFDDIRKYCLINDTSFTRCKGYPDLYDSFMLRCYPRGLLDDTPRTKIPYGPFARKLLHFMLGCCDATKTNFERFVNLWHYAWCDTFCMLLTIQLCSFGFLHLSSEALSDFGSAFDSYVHRFVQCPLTNYDLKGLMHLVGCLHILDGWGVTPGLSNEERFVSEYNYFKSIVGLVGTDETINMEKDWSLSDMPEVNVEDLFFYEMHHNQLEKKSAAGLTERVCERFGVPPRPLTVQDMGTPLSGPTQNKGVRTLWEDLLSYDIDRMGLWMQSYMLRHPPLVSEDELAYMYLDAPTGSVSHYRAANHPMFADRMVRNIKLQLDEYRTVVKAEQGGIIGHK